MVNTCANVSIVLFCVAGEAVASKVADCVNADTCVVAKLCYRVRVECTLVHVDTVGAIAHKAAHAAAIIGAISIQAVGIAVANASMKLGLFITLIYICK